MTRIDEIRINAYATLIMAGRRSYDDVPDIDVNVVDGEETKVVKMLQMVEEEVAERQLEKLGE